MQRSDAHYVPILKGRLGEFTALRNMGHEHPGHFTPLIEFVATGDELDEEGEPIVASVMATVAKTIERLEKSWPPAADVFVDLHNLPSIAGYHPVADVVDHFFRNDTTQVIPTCRPQDVDEPGLLKRLGESLSVFPDRSVCIRLSNEDLDERDEPIATYLDQLLVGLDTTPENVDLVIDFGAINETSATFAARIGRMVIADLPHLDSWKSLTVAGGASRAISTT